MSDYGHSFDTICVPCCRVKKDITEEIQSKAEEISVLKAPLDESEVEATHTLVLFDSERNAWAQVEQQESQQTESQAEELSRSRFVSTSLRRSQNIQRFPPC